MSRIIMLIPTGTSVGLTSVSLGVIRAMERKGVRLSVFQTYRSAAYRWRCARSDYDYRACELFHHDVPLNR